MEKWGPLFVAEEGAKLGTMYWLGVKTSAEGESWLYAEVGVGKLMKGSLALLST